MKLFVRGTRYESEVWPRGRIMWITTLTDNDVVLAKTLAFVTPFKRWKKYIHPWSFGHSEGWCTYNFMFRYNCKRRRISFMSFWEPIDV